MKITVSIERELDDTWATEEELADMMDEDIVDLVLSDLEDFVDDAIWSITRSTPEEDNGSSS